MRSRQQHNNNKELENMPRLINPDLCVACGSCADVCPTGAISEGEGAYKINADECIDCGACEGTCPNEAISEA